MEVKTIKDVLDYIDCGIVNNNCNSNYIVYMRMKHRFLLNSEEKNSEYLFQLLQQSNLMILERFTYKNSELRNEHFDMRDLILESVQENNKDVLYLSGSYKYSNNFKYNNKTKKYKIS